MRYVQHENRHALFLYVADDAVIADSKPPQSAELASQSLSQRFRTLCTGNSLAQKAKDSNLYGAVEGSYGAFGPLRKSQCSKPSLRSNSSSVMVGSLR